MDIRSIGAASLVRLLGGWRRAGGGPGFRQLAEALRLLILDGRLPVGVRIAGERELAAALGVSRTMVTAAFAMLREQGFLASRQGSGSVTRAPGGSGGRPAAETAGIEAGVIDFAVATLPAGESVYRAYDRALTALPLHLPGHGYEPVGIAELRARIAAGYTEKRCPTTAEQIMVTHGALHGFALVLKLLAGPGDRILIDHPTYPHAIDAILQAACRPVPVGLHSGGWDVDAIEAAIRQTGPRVAYLVADFHNPTGLCMDDATRSRIAAAVARTRTMMVVDETMTDLWLDAPPPPSLAAYDRAGCVIALGSTGKSFWGGLRVGWIRADAAIIDALARVRPAIDLGTPVLEQLATTVLLSESGVDLDARRARLRVQREALLRSVEHHLPDWRVKPPPGGLSLWAELPEAAAPALAAVSEGHGVRIAAGSRFGVGGAFERFVRLPFTRPVEELEAGIARLAAADWSLRSARPRRAAARGGVEAPVY